MILFRGRDGARRSILSVGAAPDPPLGSGGTRSVTSDIVTSRARERERFPAPAPMLSFSRTRTALKPSNSSVNSRQNIATSRT